MTTPPLLMLAEGRRVRARKAVAPKPLESAVHISIVSTLKRFGRSEWVFFHPANGEYRDPRTAAKLRAMGVRPGIPDLLFLDPDGRLRCMEIKRPGGELSDEQIEFRRVCITRGIPFVVVESVEQALVVFKEWDILRVGVSA